MMSTDKMKEIYDEFEMEYFSLRNQKETIRTLMQAWKEKDLLRGTNAHQLLSEDLRTVCDRMHAIREYLDDPTAWVLAPAQEEEEKKEAIAEVPVPTELDQFVAPEGPCPVFDELDDYSGLQIPNLPEDPTERMVAVLKHRALVANVYVCSGRRKKPNSNGNSSSQQKQRKGQRKKPRFDAWSDQVGSTVSLRSPILAAELRVPMVLEGDFTVPGGSSTGSVRFNPNALYQPVTGGSTAAINGYAPYALQYGFYRVMSYSYVVRFVNNEAFPVAVFVTNSDNDYGTAPSITAAANPLSQRRTLGPLTGQCMAVIRQRVHVSEVAGTKAVAYADSYRSLNNTTPADLMWLGVSAASMTGTALSVSVRFEMHLVMNVLWHDRLQQ